MKKLILFLALLLTAPIAAQAQQLSLAEASAILQRLDQGAFRFRQTSADGSRQSGLVYLKRPGRIRFEYEGGSDAMMIAQNGTLAIFDPRAGEPDRMPVAQTPLSIILDRNVDLTRTNVVVGTGFHQGKTVVVARDPRRPEAGQVEFYFTRSPAQLSGWVTVDANGTRTQIDLSDFSRGQLSENLFSISREMAAWPH